MEDWRKWRKERTLWTRSKSFLVRVDAMTRCSFYIDFCASSSSCCCTMAESLPSLVIICYFSSRFCTSSSSIRYSAKKSWSFLEIAVLSSCGLEIAITPIISEESWSNIFLERICCDIFLTISFEKLSSSCCNNTARIASLSVAGQNPSLMDGLIWVEHVQ